MSGDSEREATLTNDAITVRSLGVDDAVAWASLRYDALERHPLAYGTMVPLERRTLIDNAIERMAAADSVIFGAFAEGRLVGMVGVRRVEREKERHKAFIWGMYVGAESRRRGAAAMLLREAIGRARSWPGVEQVTLAVTDAAPEAKRLYERHGFRVWGVEPRALAWRGREVDETYMILDLRDPARPVT